MTWTVKFLLNLMLATLFIIDFGIDSFIYKIVDNNKFNVCFLNLEDNLIGKKRADNTRFKTILSVKEVCMKNFLISFVSENIYKSSHQLDSFYKWNKISCLEIAIFYFRITVKVV